LDAILDLTAFRYSDFGRFLVCNSPPETVPETVKKTSASNFFGVRPYFYPTMSGARRCGQTTPVIGLSQFTGVNFKNFELPCAEMHCIAPSYLATDCQLVLVSDESVVSCVLLTGRRTVSSDGHTATLKTGVSLLPQPTRKAVEVHLIPNFDSRPFIRSMSPILTNLGIRQTDISLEQFKRLLKTF